MFLDKNNTVYLTVSKMKKKILGMNLIKHVPG